MAAYASDIDSATDAPAPVSDAEPGPFLAIGELRRQYYDYLGTKQSEIAEQREARRYYHGAQWTEKELKVLKRRRQPPVTSNRIQRKIDAITGLVERLRQEPKAYPRTPASAQGADVATATLRYVLDHCDWKSKAPRIARYAAIDGFCGLELDLEYGDHGDPDVDLHIVYPDTFFYDPRSYDDGFSDARYMGVSKWIGTDQAREMFPEQEEEIAKLSESGSDMTSNPDREVTWVNTQSKKLRLVDHWYINKGRWCWAVYVGTTVLMEGLSPYFDERRKSFAKYLMFSANVDHDGDRYGPIRNLKSPQDEINHRRSKGLHILNSRRVISEKGAVDDVERARVEWSRPDGWIEVNPNKQMTPDNQQADFAGQLQMLQESKNEIENFGPNPALIGQGLQNASGRAISLLQQAGVAELGPYIISYRTWKIRVYRAIWNTIQRYWTAERWVRVTDDNDLQQFIQLNGMGTDPYGNPAIVNGLGSLDVDIILDEGPDNVSMMADAYDSLAALAQAGTKIPPDVLIELAPLQNSVKQKLLQRLQQSMQPDPVRQSAIQLEMASKAAEVEKTKAQTAQGYAAAAKSLYDAQLDAAQLGLDAVTAGADMAQQAQQAQQTVPSPPAPPSPMPPPTSPPTPPPSPFPQAPPGPVPFGPVPGAVPLGQGVPPMPASALPGMARPAPLGFPGPIPPGVLSR